ncbi:MAG TPA: PLP-dependent aminotransferase family protein [Coprothermobacter proteolyticus]|uniref:Aminotransferase, class I n=1 Tax=Coprothermobacter proteolyticus (strain ATCC 35245 / DSM 5265 / OCM 4 / BT) TaxID=309798 RepID=B5Y814_COPPD|nr:PLP-dependent aminotransferase family protein [Coprothermobacter proteolyticus]MBP8983599.1 PLP-dependent aminotransferase family protein [Coprothermobacter sp.]ACI16994.1 class I aminotransferase [Coprothermobacter proteolyticus DSM 5265]HOK23903.1 PLP-dependent aminotransferase family protein [Coprothermobacter proteolyticus]HOL52874.1 PLP-dependent aminotransferase family protein [Coprothermobacter proteolyticus]HPO83522.1 PLP-dependent aminotransferase family protein [Coprothermobacter 
MEPKDFISKRGASLKPSAIREIFKYSGDPSFISFAGGYPDPDVFPVEELKEVSVEALDKYAKKALQYSATEGVPELRQYLVKFMEEEENVKGLGEENIIITTASQQSLFLVGLVLIDPGDVVMVEAPTYLGALSAFDPFEPDYVSVPTDDDGIIPEKLEEMVIDLKKKGKKVKFLYVIPTFQNPAGYTLSLERRKRIVEIAEEQDFLIVEDDPYSYLVYEGERPPCVKSFDNSDHVIYLSTFSKTFVPGFRLGWIVAHKDIIRRIAISKQAADLCTGAYMQYITYLYMQKGHFMKHIEAMRDIYKVKHAAMLEALDKYMSDIPGVYWSKPKGGFFVWLVLPETVDCDQLFDKAIEHKVVYVRGSAFFADGQGKNTARLNFSQPKVEDIDKGIKILADVIKETMGVK